MCNALCVVLRSSVARQRVRHGAATARPRRRMVHAVRLRVHRECTQARARRQRGGAAVDPCGVGQRPRRMRSRRHAVLPAGSSAFDDAMQCSIADVCCCAVCAEG